MNHSQKDLTFSQSLSTCMHKSNSKGSKHWVQMKSWDIKHLVWILHRIKFGLCPSLASKNFPREKYLYHGRLLILHCFPSMVKTLGTLEMTKIHSSIFLPHS